MCDCTVIPFQYPCQSSNLQLHFHSGIVAGSNIVTCGSTRQSGDVNIRPHRSAATTAVLTTEDVQPITPGGGEEEVTGVRRQFRPISVAPPQGIF